MDFCLSEEHAFLLNTVRTFVKRECPRERVHALDEEGTFPADLLAKLAAMGLCSLNVPEAFGGVGQDFLGTLLVVEEIAAMSPALAGLFGSMSLYGGAVITMLGSSQQQERWLPDVASGEVLFSSAPIEVEPAHSVTARADGSEFVLEGRVPFVTFAQLADCVIVQASIDDGSEKTVCFVVPTDTPGVQIASVDTIGWRGAGSGTVHVDAVRLPRQSVLGGEDGLDQGAAQAELIQSIQRVAIAALGVGLAQGAIDYAANYAGERSQFGQPIIAFEAIQHMLVNLLVDLQSTRWLLRHACWQADQGERFGLEAAMACLRATALARDAGLQSVHILGGYGYMAEYDAERYMRDSLLLLSGSDASALLKTDIGMLKNLKGAA